MGTGEILLGGTRGVAILRGILHAKETGISSSCFGPLVFLTSSIPWENSPVIFLC